MCDQRIGVLAAVAAVFLLYSCQGIQETFPGQWEGSVKGEFFRAEWMPRQPRVGDYVDLVIFPDLVELTWGGGMREHPVERSARGARYRLLMREPGEFQPQDWPRPFWIVPQEDNFPEGWQSLAVSDLFPFPFWGSLGISAAGMIGLAAVVFFFVMVRGKKKPFESPGGEVALLAELESAKERLHDMSPGELKSLPMLLDRGWKLFPEKAPDLAGAWFSHKDLDWAQLEARYRNRREKALYAGREMDWETWEEELDVVLYRLRRSHV